MAPGSHRLEGSGYVTWAPGADGWWHGSVLEVYFVGTQPFLGVRDREGTMIAPSGVVRRQAAEDYTLAASHLREVAHREGWRWYDAPYGPRRSFLKQSGVLPCRLARP